MLPWPKAPLGKQRTQPSPPQQRPAAAAVQPPAAAARFELAWSQSLQWAHQAVK